MSTESGRVADVMQTSVHFVEGLAPVQDAINEMHRLNVSSLVVERRDEADEYGIVTVHDIADKIVAINRSVRRTSVYETMSKPALALSPTMNVKYAVRLLSQLNINRALVLEGSTLLGLVTLRDLIVSYSEGDAEHGADG